MNAEQTSSSCSRSAGSSCACSTRSTRPPARRTSLPRGARWLPRPVLRSRRCSSGSSWTTTSAAPRTSSATSRPVSRSSSTPRTRSSSTSTRRPSRGVRLVGVLETHTHADHVSGHGRLALEHGAAGARPRRRGGDVPARAARGRDGGRARRRRRCARSTRPATGRSTARSRSIDRSRGDEPWLVLTGDSLFVGDAARPDLAVEAARRRRRGSSTACAGWSSSATASRSIPGHVAGSLCGAAMSSKASTTIGFERRFNHALRESHADFLAAAAGPQPPRPPNMERIVELNRGPFLGGAAAARAARRASRTAPSCSTCGRRRHSWRGTRRARSACRSPARASGRRRRSSSPSGPCVLHASGEARRARAARALLRGRPASSSPAGRRAAATETLEPVTLDELRAAARRRRGRVARRPRGGRARRGAIPGTRGISPTARRARRRENGLLDGRPVVTICESGPRAAVAASVLQSVGVDARPVLDGGVATWRAAGSRATSA